MTTVIYQRRKKEKLECKIEKRKYVCKCNSMIYLCMYWLVIEATQPRIGISTKKIIINQAKKISVLAFYAGFNPLLRNIHLSMHVNMKADTASQLATVIRFSGMFSNKFAQCCNYKRNDMEIIYQSDYVFISSPFFRPDFTQCLRCKLQ